MQYFTFIGMGDKENGYREVYYSFEDDPKQAVLSRFVQELIIKRHEKDLSEVYIFATKESRERYEKDLNALFDKKVALNFINISKDITYEDYTLELLKYMKENEDIVLDITHSFRYIPIKLLFALKYIELTKNVHIQHLYYGLLKKEDVGEVVDFVSDYMMQQISDLLAQFNRTLMINGEDIDVLIAQKDDKIKNFLKSLSTFNKMIEYCEFDSSLKEIRKITEPCSSIEKNKDRYSLIIPIVKQIKDKFKFYSECKNDVEKKEELIRNTLEPLNNKFDLEIYLKNKKMPSNGSATFYRISQFLKTDVYKLVNGKTYFKYEELLDGKENEVKQIKNILTTKQKDTIDKFFNEIRNHMNHGTSIQTEIEPILYDMLDCIRLIGRRDK